MPDDTALPPRDAAWCPPACPDGRPITVGEAVEAIQLDLLRRLGQRQLVGERCRECDSWAFGATDNTPGWVLVVCTYCGQDWLADPLAHQSFAPSR